MNATQLLDRRLAIIGGVYSVDGVPVDADRFRQALIDTEHEVFEHVAHEHLRQADGP